MHLKTNFLSNENIIFHTITKKARIGFFLYRFSIMTLTTFADFQVTIDAAKPVIVVETICLLVKSVLVLPRVFYF